MKKALLVMAFIMLLFAFILSVQGEQITSTASMLVVNEKGHTDNYDEYWIKAYDPNNQTKDEAFKIMVEDEMVWELIEEKKEYFSSYQKEGDQPWILEQIEHPDSATTAK